MKKILGIIALFAIVFSSSASAEIIGADYEFNPRENAYVVYGVSDDEKSGDEITIEVKLNNNVIDTVVTETYSEDGIIKYKSPLIKINAFKESGEISFNVYSANYDAPVTLPVEGETEILYYGVDDTLYQVLSEIDAVLPISDKSEYNSLIDFIKSNKSLLGLSREVDILNNLGEKSDSSMYAYSKTISMCELPSDILSQDNIRTAFEYLTMLRNEICNMIIFGEFTDVSSSAEFISWYDKYTDLLDMQAEDEEYYSYFINNYKTAKFYDILKSKSMIYDNEDKLKARLFETAALVAVASGNATAVEAVFNTFENEMNLTSRFNSVLEGKIFSSMSGQTYASFEDLTDTYYKKGRANASSNSNQSSGSGSGNSSSAGSSVLVPGIKPADTQPQVKDKIFTDLRTAAWAEEAVYYLYEKGIIAGRSDSTFEPNANITRAEFVKLLVAISNNIKQDTTQIFSDVNQDEWYYDYVNTAYLNGYTTGRDDGTFAPNDNVTRQDMAVLIYRYLGSPKTNSELTQFSDSEDIGDYAKAAVSYLYDKNVIDGMGNGTFSPKDNATRAQAAQMIYKIIS